MPTPKTDAGREERGWPAAPYRYEQGSHAAIHILNSDGPLADVLFRNHKLARLWCAAPEIYEALRMSRMYVECCDAPELLAIVDAALLKALGGRT